MVIFDTHALAKQTESKDLFLTNAHFVMSISALVLVAKTKMLRAHIHKY